MDKLVKGAATLGLRLTSKQLEQFQIYYQELVAWNKRMNLTAIVDCDQVQVRHFLDSLAVTLALGEGVAEGFSLIDVGTGAGLPGIPLKILFPRARLVLLDSVAKKTSFLRHVVGRLGLEDVDIVAARAEDLAHQPQYREQFALVLSRALATLPTLVELTLPFCRLGGVFVAHKKGDIARELTKAARAIETMGGRLREVKRVDLEELGDGYVLVIMDKVSPTPESYPRRPGMPSRRPL